MKTKNKKFKTPGQNHKENHSRADQNSKLTDVLQEALRHHQASNFDTATILYNRVLGIQPNNIDAISLLGALNLQRGNHDVACMLLRKSLALKPDNAIAHNNLGSALQASGKFQGAINSYKRAIELKQDYDEAYYNLGNTLQACKLLEEAIVVYQHALAIKPNDADIHNNLAEAFRKSRKPDEALKCYKQAAMLNPHNTEILCNLGAVFQELGNLDEAIINYKKAITLKPDNAKAHSNLGTALKKQCKPEEAVKSHHRAIELKPDYAEAHNNLGITFHSLNQLDEAVACYNRAVELKPDYAEAYNNLGITLQSLNQLDAAVTSYNRAIELKPDYAEARFNKSLISLLKGNFKDGWQEYEWRLRTKDHEIRAFQQPMWNGTPLNNMTILVHTEQGLGDSIQFIRYIPLVKEQCGRVIVECQQSLCSLFRNCDGIDEIKEIASDIEPPIQFDVHIPLLSLPGIFDTTVDSIPPSAPYLKPDPALVSQWHRKLDHNSDFMIGVVWAGNHNNKNDHKRSCSLKDFEHLTTIQGLTFYSLQKGQAAVEADNPPIGMNIINLTNELNDFADTAAVIENLDLVISVDTSVAHLAGAIGKPVWTLLPFVPDWRWMLERNDSQWYPSMRLFRQNKLNDWRGVFDQVKEALISDCKKRSTASHNQV